jgi:uncharacterized protein YndB with AHSA1/START domain
MQAHNRAMEQSVTIDIAATPERVWQVLSDVESWRTWTPTITSVNLLDDGQLRVGSRAKVRQPRLGDAEYVVTELVAGRSFTWVAEHPGVLTTARHTVEPLASGVRVRLSVAQTGWLGALMGRLYRGLTDRYLTNEANGLKRLCEAAS